MKKVLKYFIISFSLILLIIAVLIFRPVPIVSEEIAITEEGTVSEIFSNPGNDIIFIMKNTERRFYINRGLENGLELDNLKDNLIGNTIIVKYPNYWTPLDWNNSIKHISKLEFNGEVLFNELQ